MIRKAVEDDIASITDIFNDAILNTYANFEKETKSLEQMKQWFYEHKEPYTVLVEADGDIIKGYVALSPYKNGKAVESVYISKDYRGMGIGTSLLSAVIDYARSQESLKMVIAYITDINKSSIKIHEATGFKASGIVETADSKFDKTLDLYLYRVAVN